MESKRFEKRPGSSSPTEDTTVSFKKATLRIRQRLILPDTNWVVKRNQHWAILGPNGAGKTTLVRALTGKVPVVRGTIWPPDIGSCRKRFEWLSTGQQRLVLIARAMVKSPRILTLVPSTCGSDSQISTRKADRR